MDTTLDFLDTFTAPDSEQDELLDYIQARLEAVQLLLVKDSGQVCHSPFMDIEVAGWRDELADEARALGGL